MKYLKQFSIILLLSFIGEALHALIPLPVPASIYGIVIMFFSLRLGIIKVSAVKETADFLIDIMPIMFIPAAVGLMNTFETVALYWWQYLIVIMVSTVLVIVVSGKVTSFIRRRNPKNEEKTEVRQDD